MAVDAIELLTIAEVAELLRARKLSPVELAQQHLKRIAALNETTKAFLHVTADTALTQARQSQQEIASGTYRGPLHGVPISLKDLYYTKDIRTTAGSRVLADFVPTFDATVWAQLRRAGAVLLGKTNMYEFARGATATKGNSLMPAARNPWDLTRIPGGSSDGSAVAVSCGMGLASMGSDTAGSVRIPAALCGLVGIRPTQGLVSRYGVVPLSHTFDECGPLTRTAKDCALMLEAIAGYDAADDMSVPHQTSRYSADLARDVCGLRMGVPRDFFFQDLHPEVERAVQHAITLLENMGVVAVEVSIPSAKSGGQASKTLVLHEAAAFHQKWLRERPQDYSEPIRRSLQEATLLTADEIREATQIRASITSEFAAALHACDFVISPTVPVPAPKFADIETEGHRSTNRSESLDAVAKITRPTSLTGLPCLSVPCGFTHEALPVAFQLVGRPFEESLLFALAHQYQGATDWHRRRSHPD